MRQGPRQAAQKSTKTMPLSSRVWAKDCWVMSMVAMICRVLSGEACWLRCVCWLRWAAGQGLGGGEPGAGPGGHAAGHGVRLVANAVEGIGDGGAAVAAAADGDHGHGRVKLAQAGLQLAHGDVQGTGDHAL